MSSVLTSEGTFMICGKTCVADAIEVLDPGIKVICLLVAGAQRDAAAIGRKR
jgi:hypothetical protein